LGGLAVVASTLSHADAACGNDPGCDPTHPYLIAWHGLPAPTYPVWRRVIRLQADETVRDRATSEGAGTVLTRDYRMQAVTINRSESVYRALVLEHGREHVDRALNDTSPSRIDELRIKVIEQGPSQPARVQVHKTLARKVSAREALQIACPTDSQALPCFDSDSLASESPDTATSLTREASQPIRAGRPVVSELMETVLEMAGWQQTLRGARLFIGPAEHSPSVSVTTGADAGIQSFTSQNILPTNLMVVDSQSGNGGGVAVGWSEAVSDDSVRAVLHRVMAFDDHPGQAFTQTVQVCARGKAASGLCL
jgi:hypothetical protein